MDLTNYKEDFRELRKGTVSELAEMLGVEGVRIYKYVEKAGITQKYVELCDAMGYDVKLNYIKKGRTTPERIESETFERLKETEKELKDTKLDLEYARKLIALAESDLWELSQMDLPPDALKILEKWTDEWSEPEV